MKSTTARLTAGYFASWNKISHCFSKKWGSYGILYLRIHKKLRRVHERGFTSALSFDREGMQESFQWSSPYQINWIPIQIGFVSRFDCWWRVGINHKGWEFNVMDFDLRNTNFPHLLPSIVHHFVPFPCHPKKLKKLKKMRVIPFKLMQANELSADNQLLKSQLEIDALSRELAFKSDLYLLHANV